VPSELAESIDYDRLARAVQNSSELLKRPRQYRLEMAREVAGHRYGAGGADKPRKVNLLSLYQNLIGGTMIPQEPRYLLAARGGAPRSAVRTEQDWLNEQAVRIHLADDLRSCVYDALYWESYMKVALTSPCDAATSAWGVTAGEPGAWSIDPDDMVYDMSAKRPREFTFIGHRYRCPKEVAKKLYGKKAAESAGDYDRDFNRDGGERIERIGRGLFGSYEEFEDHVELWEICLPRHGKVVTLLDKDVLEADPRSGKARPLWEQPMIAGPHGQYVRLCFMHVPGNPSGKGPMSDLWELDQDANNTHRKISRMAARMKELTLYRRRNDEDANEIATKPDGSMVGVEDPETIKTVVTAGNALPVLMTVAAQFKELFDFVSNVSIVGGRGPQAKTATQEKILAASAGAGIGVMQNAVLAFAAKVGESLLWLSHHHPQLEMSSDYKVPGLDISEPRTLYPSQEQQRKANRFPIMTPARDHAFASMNFRIDPYSLSFRSPEERLAFLDQTVMQIAPLLPLFEQRGASFDPNVYMAYKSEYGDAPELKEMFTIRKPLGQDEGGATELPHDQTLPAQTNREYTRHNVSEDKGSQSQQLLARMQNVDLGGVPSTNGAMG
jgi:hypothetical protein